MVYALYLIAENDLSKRLHKAEQQSYPCSVHIDDEMLCCHTKHLTNRFVAEEGPLKGRIVRAKKKENTQGNPAGRF